MKKKKYSGGLFFLLIIPFGFIAIIYLFDFGQNIYYQKQLDNCVKEVMTETLNREGLTTTQEYKEFAKRKFSDRGYETDDMSLLDLGDYYILVNYKSYKSVVGGISFGKLRTKKILVHSAYKGYYNEYKEAVIEKFKEDTQDILIEDEELLDDYGNPIVIN